MSAISSSVKANHYLAFEEKAFLRHYLKVNTHRGLVFYKRYIDDIFMIFRGSREAHNDFMAKMSFAPLGLKFHTTNGGLPFLNVRVYFDRYGCTASKDYSKPSSTFSYISYSSAHLLHVKRVFLKAELIRQYIICADQHDFLTSSLEFIERLRSRNYPDYELAHAFRTVKHTDRHNVLTKQDKYECEQRPLLLPSMYSVIWNNISTRELKRIIKNHWKVSHSTIPPQLEVGITKSLHRTCNLSDYIQRINQQVLENPVNASDDTGSEYTEQI